MMSDPVIMPILVGIDGSPPADRAVAWAAAEAALRGRLLHIIHVTECWPYDIPLWRGCGSSRERRISHSNTGRGSQ